MKKFVAKDCFNCPFFECGITKFAWDFTQIVDAECKITGVVFPNNEIRDFIFNMENDLYSCPLRKETLVFMRDGFKCGECNLWNRVVGEKKCSITGEERESSDEACEHWIKLKVEE